MGFLGSFFGVFCFVIGIPLGLLVGFFLFVYSEAKQVKVSTFFSLFIFLLHDQFL
jgi:ABC-type phosphate transport system permease subunit